MAENDEPIDDLRAVGMTAGAAAARIAETVIRDQQNRAVQRHQDRAVVTRPPARDQAAAERRYQEQVAKLESRLGPDVKRDELGPDVERNELEQARQWATPERRTAYDHEVMGSDSIDGRQQADHQLLREWKAATAEHSPLDDVPLLDRKDSHYDADRPARDNAMREHGVPDDVRHAFTTADKLNGTNPQLAAAAGSKTKARPGRTNPAPERERGR